MIREKRDNQGSCLKIILITGAVMFLLVVIAGTVAYMNRRSIGAYIMKAASDSIITGLDLESAEREGLKAELDSLIQRYKDKEIEMEDIGKIFEEFEKRKTFEIFILSKSKDKVISNSGLTEEEKGNASQKMDDFLKGIKADKLTNNEIERVLKLFSNRDEQSSGDSGGVKVTTGKTKTMSDDEIKDAVKILEEVLKDKEIPEGPFEFSIVEEFKTVIAETLK